MTPMRGAFDWLAVGDVAEERDTGNHPSIGGGAARLAAHAASLKASTAIVGKVGDDEPARRLFDAFSRLGIDVRWLHAAPGMRTTVWIGPDNQPRQRRVQRGADLSLRLDELPPPSIKAALTVVSGYSLSVEPARSAAMGALSSAAARGGRSALLVDVELLWSSNARMTRRVLEPALAAADSIALSEADARILLGPLTGRQTVRSLARMGPRTVFLSQADGAVIVRDGGRIFTAPSHPAGAPLRDRYAGPAAFWVALADRRPVAKALADSVRYAAMPHTSERRKR